MTSPVAGDPAPDFTLNGPTGPVTLADARQHGPVLLLFFFEASTPACDAQLRGFGAEYDLIRELGAGVLAISTDSPAAQQRFRDQLDAPFPMLSDADGEVAKAYGVYDPASGRANRAAFVIGQDGAVTLALPWYNPQNSAQFAEVFASLGVDAGG